jgi:hypothetical protein
MPICGPQTTSSLGTDASQAVATVSEVWSVAGAILGILKLGPSLFPSWFPAISLTAAGQVAVAAALVAIATIAVIIQIYSDRCSSKTGIPDCFSGVVNDIVPAFSSTTDAIFPFVAVHDRVDVVVRSIYIEELRTYSQYVYCLDTAPVMSPVLMAFYHNAQLCAAGAGAVAGAVVGGIVGTLLAAAAWTALGCVTIIFCLFALIIAALIALAAVIVGAVIGSQAAKAATSSTKPSTSGPHSQALHVGDVVTVQGNLIVATFLQGEAVYWWTTDTALHGHINSNPPFSTTDADNAFSSVPDSCPISNPPIQ